MVTMKTLIRLRGRAGRSESSLGVKMSEGTLSHAVAHVFGGQ